MVAALLVGVAPLGLHAQRPDSTTEARARALLGRMTRDEKFWQLYMAPGDLDSASYDYSRGVFGLQIGAKPGVPPREAARAHAARVDSIQRWFRQQSRLGIPIIPFDEALHGLMRDGATVFPQAIGLAATFDSGLVGRVHDAAARETRARGIRMVLSPVVNLATDVRWGRTEETFGEDVHLTGVMGRQFVRAFESRGVVTTAKHFVANVGEGGRDSYPVEWSPRALDERFFPPFKSLITQAGARAVMTAYNTVDGTPATQNRGLLTDVLRNRWGFGGIVISDAAATAGATVLARTEASTATAAAHAFAAGLDVIFQSSYPEHRPYLQAIRDGVVPEATLDSAVLRVLRLKFALGLFDDTSVPPDSAAAAAHDPTHRRLAREAATASVVLLRNASRRGRTADTLAPRTLPFAAGTRRIAVIGPDADTVRLGGYAGPGVAPVSIAAAIRARVGRTAQVRVVRGASRAAHTHRVVPSALLESTVNGTRQPGLHASYWDNPWLEGTPRVQRADATIDFRWTLGSPARELPYDWYSARWTGTLIVPPEGITRLGVDGNDGVRLWLDGALVLDAWEKRSAGVQLAAVRLAGGTRHDLRVEYTERTGNARLSLVYDAPRAVSPEAEIAAAVAAARASEVAVVVVGIEEGEFRDRARLSLPGHQEALIRAVAATGTPTTVVIIGGSAVTMSRWIDSVGAVLMAWYPGEEGGPAIAGLLFGDTSPSGRLPITFPLEEGQLPLTYDHKPTGRGDDYVDLTGQPLFPFGYGLSYTAFAYDQLRIASSGRGDSVRVTVRARVRNTGTRRGTEIVQLYLRDVLTSVAQPLTALKGVAPVTLAPGEATEVTFVLTAEHLRLLDASMRWVVEPGEFRVMVGASSRDIRLRDTFVVQ